MAFPLGEPCKQLNNDIVFCVAMNLQIGLFSLNFKRWHTLRFGCSKTKYRLGLQQSD